MDEQPNTASTRPGDRDSGDGTGALSQVDVTLDQLGRLCARLEQAEQRFKQMTDECGSVLDGLVAVDRRHSTALATLNDRLGDWCTIERKLLEESARRIERFERGVEHEWTALRRLHEEPISDLRDQADKLRLACLDAARLARQRLDAAEQAYALQTADFERRMGEWARRVLQAATGRELPAFAEEGSGDLAMSSPTHVEPWPLDGVAHLHQELRTGGPAPPPHDPAPAVAHEDAAPVSPPPDRDATAVVQPAVSGTTAPAPRDETPPAADAPVERVAPWTRAAASPRLHARIVWAVFAIVLGVVVFVIASYIFEMQRRLVDLESQARAATRQGGAPQAAPAESKPEEVRTPEPQQVAQRAGTMVNILAAPDLRRYDLAGVGGGQGAYGQVLWSRSHGMAVTAVRLPAAGAGKVYRVWVSGDGRSESPGVLAPDGTGTVRLVVEGPLKLPRAEAIVVTLESAGAADRPNGPAYLTRVPTS